ncbi:MAG TPA: rhomboid family intramembrane serine protease [Bacteroidales bacterium]|nr:rhomboid family intramembrane serine protease [Bacteroidales bacterium]HRX97321.1 rhomboid family intramembrane serine protease [Bacteroidales bacterium]
MDQYRPTGFRILPPVVKNLIIINALFYLGTIAASQTFHIDLADYLGLHYPVSSLFKPHQLVTYMFMHGSPAHILFNMFAVWMFGSTLENVWGPKRFLIFYMITGIGAGLIQLAVSYVQVTGLEAQLDPETITMIRSEGLSIYQQGNYFTNPIVQKLNLLYNIPTVGASGSIFGLLLAFGMLFPNALIYLYFAIPIKAKYFVIGYGLIELFSGVANKPGDNVAHFAHLGGMLFGYFLIVLWKRRR